MNGKVKKQSEKFEKNVINMAHTLPQEGKGHICSDVNGSYTGTPEDGGVPVQDADDL